MGFHWKHIGKRWAGLTLSACIVAAFYVALTHLTAIASALKTGLHFCQPVIIGVVIAYILTPLANYLQRTVFRRMRSRRAAGRLAIAVTVVLVLILLLLLLGMLIPQLINSIVGFVGNLDMYVASLRRFVSALGIQSEELEQKLAELVSDENGILQRITNMLTSNIGRIAQVMSSVGGQAVNWIISFIMAIYLLADKARIVGAVRRFFRLALTDDAYMHGAGIWRRFNEILSKYITFELIDALIVGGANYLFMTIMGMPYALLVSAVVGVTNLVPTFGPIVGAAVGAFILLLAEPLLVLWFLGFTIILQAVDGYIIKPKMYGDALNIPSILVLAAVIIGGRMFGVVGILLAIPCAALLMYLYEELLIPWLKARKEGKTRRADPPAGAAVSVPAPAGGEAERPDGEKQQT